MEVIIVLLTITAALLVITSGIWVAFALGSAISKDDKKKISTGTKDS